MIVYFKIVFHCSSFFHKHVNIFIFSNIVSGVNEGWSDWSHHVEEKSRRVRLHEDEGRKGPNSDNKAKR